MTIILYQADYFRIFFTYVSEKNIDFIFENIICKLGVFMKMTKAIAKALIFEQEALKLGFKPEQIEFILSNEKNPFQNRRLLIKLNGLTFDCFGYYDSNLNIDDFRKQYAEFSKERKEVLLKQNNEFIIHHNGSLDKFRIQELPYVLKLNNWTIPNMSN